MQMKVFSLSALDIMEPIMQSNTVKIEVVTVRTKTNKKTFFKFFYYVLVSAGIELTVFLAAGTVLCFEFSM